MRRARIAALALIFPLAGVLAAPPAQAATPGVVIYKVQYDPPGSDTGSNTSRNGEYVLLKNTGRYSTVLAGWTLSDKEGHRYTFPSMRISAGKTLYIRTGIGTNNWYTRYWGSSSYIWNNTGDKAYLRSPSGTLLDSCAWGSTGSSITC
jgi:hypothetical protein